MVLLVWLLHVLRVAGVRSPCEPNPCRNAATCIATGAAHTCVCATGYTGPLCETNIDDCTEACLNGGTCSDLVAGFACNCTLGYRGQRCEERDYWTLQQWKGGTCADGAPWRCFRLQMGQCIDTGREDGVGDHWESWYGRLHLGDDLRYSLDLCFGRPRSDSPRKEAPSSRRQPWLVPDDWCDCGNHFADIRRFGQNSLGPPTPGLEKPDSRWCHKLMEITATRLVNSTGMHSSRPGRGKDDEETNVDCHDPNGSPRRPWPLARTALLTSALLAAAASGKGEAAYEGLMG